MRIMTTTLTLLLAATLVSGCGDDDKPSSDPTGDSSATATASSSEESTPPDFAGSLIDRPDYSFHLPEDWVDTTEEHSIADPEDTYATGGGGTLDDVDLRLTVDVEQDVSKKLFDYGLDNMVKRIKSSYSPQVKRLPDTKFADTTSIHAQGPGLEDGSLIQVFYLHHANASYYISVQTLGGRKANEAAVDAVRSSWEWK
ncbi:hypothetical protein ASG90_05690 [Nocardioides sp. Soil797]|nr:hypothetical protein ASG90_05690 [Nocardioides sp. Soil797]